MLKIDQLFFRNFIAVLALVLMASGLVTYFWFKDIYIAQVKKNLSQNIDTVAMTMKSLDGLDGFVDEYSTLVDLRITFIALDGLVLAESDDDKHTMDNHKNRPEILDLQENKTLGTYTRVSDTTKRNHLYAVKKVDIAGDTLYLRMAEDIEDINERFVQLSLSILAIFLLSFVVAISLALRINKTLKNETDNILEILHNLLEKKQFKVKTYGTLKEFNKITKLLNEVGGKLKHRQNLKTKQNAKLKLANRQKDEIISALSHEFKNPIAVIKGYCETMIKNNIDEEVKKKFLLKIEHSAMKMSDIIDKLRLSIKLEDGKQGLKFEKVDLKLLATGVAQELEQNYKQRRILVSGEGATVSIDRVLFSIALSNLIENGLKYSSEDVEVLVYAEHLEVIDRGLGLDDKEIENITKKFYRVSGNSWNNSLGLGLNIVDNIIKLHEFELQIQSKKSVGSKFIIKFD
ncbi:MAG: sensor histidine kinase [Campylobacterota bacterium]